MSRYERDRDYGSGGGGRRDSRNIDCKVYVGDLPRDITEKDIERAFSYYGPIRSVWVARNPSGFAFVEFEDSRDADDGVRGLDGSTLCGGRIRVEMSTGKVRPKPWMRRGGGGGMSRGGGGGGGGGGRRSFDPNDKCYECGERGHYAYDCRNRSRGGRKRSRSRSYERSRRSYSRSRSHSRSRSRDRKRSITRSPRRSRSRSAGHDD